MKIELGATYLNLVQGKYIAHPDLGSVVFFLSLECLIFCLQSGGCTTVNICQSEIGIVCQLSKRKGTCLEKEEVSARRGCSLYQRKVRMVWDEIKGTGCQKCIVNFTRDQRDQAMNINCPTRWLWQVRLHSLLRQSPFSVVLNCLEYTRNTKLLPVIDWFTIGVTALCLQDEKIASPYFFMT